MKISIKKITVQLIEFIVFFLLLELLMNQIIGLFPVTCMGSADDEFGVLAGCIPRYEVFGSVVSTSGLKIGIYTLFVVFMLLFYILQEKFIWRRNAHSS